MEIKDNIRILRRKGKITQKELAEVLYVNHTKISNWENDVSEPSLQSAIMIADYFDVTLDELVGRKGSLKEGAKFAFCEIASETDFLTIFDLIKEFNISLSELAKEVDVSVSTIKNWSRNGLPKIENYIKLFRFCKLDLEMILKLK